MVENVDLHSKHPRGRECASWGEGVLKMHDDLGDTRSFLMAPHPPVFTAENTVLQKGTLSLLSPLTAKHQGPA